MAQLETSPIPWVQKILDFLQTPEPEWMKEATQALQNQMVALAEAAGKAYLAYLVGQVAAINSDTSLSGSQKLQAIVTAAKDPAQTITPAKALGESELNTLVSGLIAVVEKSGKF